MGSPQTGGRRALKAKKEAQAKEKSEAISASGDILATGDNSYQDTLANLTRADWQHFNDTYLPIQNDIIDLAQGDQLVNEQLVRSEDNVNNAFAKSDTSQSMTLGRYGKSLDESQQDNTNTQLLKNLTTASVKNETRRSVGELQDKMITGQSSKPRGLSDIGAKA